MNNNAMLSGFGMVALKLVFAFLVLWVWHSADSGMKSILYAGAVIGLLPHDIAKGAKSFYCRNTKRAAGFAFLALLVFVCAVFFYVVSDHFVKTLVFYVTILTSVFVEFFLDKWFPLCEDE